MVAALSTADPTGASGGSTPGRGVLSSDVLKAVRKRDPDALGQLFEACFGRVYSLAHRLTGSREQAEDVTQEVFLKVYNAAEQLDPTRDPAPWLATITYNACREHWRSRGHRQDRQTATINGDDGMREKLVNGKRSPERRVVNGERKALVEKAIRRLPEEMRAVVLLHDFEGLSHAEVAETLGESHASVRKRYSRALTWLHEELKDVLE
jgi:RNA polymerase sigma-70 factor (ECF subfamily)